MKLIPRLIVLIIFQLITIISFADSSYLNTPRILRIKLDYVSGSDEANIISSNKTLELYDLALNKTIFNGKATKMSVSGKKNGEIAFTINEKTYIASRSVRISNRDPRGSVITLSPSTKNTKKYRGKLEVRCSREKLYWVNIVDMEDYLKSVVPSEISPISPKAAIEAQSIAARTYAIRNINRHIGNVECNLCDTTHCQAYEGVSKETRNSNSAVKDTEGKILVYADMPANTVYHSNCGGYIVSSKAEWGGKVVPYLIGHFDGQQGDKSFCEYGNYYLRYRKSPNLPSKSKRLVIGVTEISKKRKKTHSNFGHRVGMCQDGAIGMALIGYSCSNILGFYYPTTTIETLKYAKRNNTNKYAPTQISSVLNSKGNPTNNSSIPIVTNNKIASKTQNIAETKIASASKEIITSNKKIEIAQNKLSPKDENKNITLASSTSEIDTNITGTASELIVNQQKINIANSSVSISDFDNDNAESHFIVVNNIKSDINTATADLNDSDNLDDFIKTLNLDENGGIDDSVVVVDNSVVTTVQENDEEDYEEDDDSITVASSKNLETNIKDSLPNNETSIELSTVAKDNQISSTKQNIFKPVFVFGKTKKTLLKNVKKEIYCPKPNSTYLVIKKMFWTPSAPIIITKNTIDKGK